MGAGSDPALEDILRWNVVRWKFVRWGIVAKEFDPEHARTE